MPWGKYDLSPSPPGRGFNGSRNLVPVQNLFALTHVERARDEKQKNLKIILVEDYFLEHS